MWIRFSIEMLTSFDGASAPRTSRKLVGRPNAAADELIAPCLFDRFDCIIGSVRSRLAPHP